MVDTRLLFYSILINGFGEEGIDSKFAIDTKLESNYPRRTAMDKEHQDNLLKWTLMWQLKYSKKDVSMGFWEENEVRQKSLMATF